MAENISFILCEGPHDVAFLVKILKTVGFIGSSDQKALSEFPFPINNYLKNQVGKINVEDLRFDQIRSAVVPSATLIKDNHHLFFYATGGDSRADLRQSILTDLVRFVPELGEITGVKEDNVYSLVYFFDADTRGVDSRINSINSELEPVLGSRVFSVENRITSHSGLQLAIYVFTGSDNKSGKLEDIILPLMESGNEKIFKDADTYLDDNQDKKRVKRNNFDRSKAKIGIAGQLQKSGSTNTVIIGQTDYITTEKITGNIKCKEIIDFFKRLYKIKNI